MNTSYAKTNRRAFGLAGALIAILGCAGCGWNASASDPAEGRVALVFALEAWKGGGRPEFLASQPSPVHVSDGDWMSGFRLLNFKAEDEGRLIGSDVNYNVVLELKGARGRAFKKDAVYAVTTGPQVLVLRQDSL